MKKVLSLLLLGALSLTSCKKYLQENPRDFISPDNFPVSASDADLLLAGTLGILAGGNLYQRGYYFLAEVSSDQTVANYTSGSRWEISTYNYTPDNEYISDVWESFYQAINNANIMIAKIPRSSMNETVKNHYVGAARFLRALCYFNLVRLYGKLPLITKPVNDFNEADGITRSDVKDVYDLVVQDLQFACANLPETWPDGKPGRPDLGAAHALLSKVYLTMAGDPVKDQSKWQLAANEADSVMRMKKYSLLDHFADLWKVADNNNKEIIFSIQNYNTTGSRTMMTVQSRPTNIGQESGWGFWYTAPGFMNTFSDQDTRKAATFLTEANGVNYKDFPGGRPYIKKWYDDGRDNLLENNKRTSKNFPILRYAAVLLIYAEAENEAKGPDQSAYDAINQVRKRAGLKNLSGLSKDQFRQAVRQERSRELAFECKRKFDLVRWGEFMHVFSKIPGIKDHIKPYMTIYPVPTRELSLNPQLGQNDGY